MLAGHRAAWISVACAVILTAGVAGADPTPRELFEQADKNKDGKLTANELPPKAIVVAAQFDANRDRAISLDEFVEFLRKTIDPNATAEQARKPQESVRSLLDIPYADTKHERQRLDLFLPRSPKSKLLPLIVFIHGGGWIEGNKNQGGPLLLPYVAGGEFAGASVAYRFSSDAAWPAQIHDCKAAIRWLRANASKHGIDPDRIGVWGMSAGGHLVSLLGTSGDVDDLDGEVGAHRDASSRVSCVVNYCGPTNLLTVGSNAGNTTKQAVDMFVTPLLGGPVTEKADAAREASAVTYISAKDPPFLVTHGTNDELVPFDQSVRFNGALKSAGVDAVFVPVRGGGHNILLAPGLSDRVKLFFERHLLDKRVSIPSGPIAAGP
jgi:acetyl esterase/lipase